MIDVPKDQGDEPVVALDMQVLDFINSSKVPQPPAFNAYQCERRGGHIILTVDIHPGVTPMFLGCKFPFCPGTMKSMVYPPPPIPDVLKQFKLWVWYRPSLRELMDHDQSTTDHVMQGGLMLRESPQNYDQFMEEWNAHH